MHTCKTNPTFQRALNNLAHPFSLAAIGVLLLNALLFQRLWPSWWTGKMGDAAWLMFTPLLLAAGLAWIIPANINHHDRVVGWLAVSLIGLGFAAVKTIPAVNANAAWLFKALTGFPAKLALDPTDLLTLPALGLAWHLWNTPPVPWSVRLAHLRWVALAAAVAAIIADSPAPQNLGMTCLGQLNTSVLAFQEYNNRRTIVFRSDDGGLSWRQAVGGSYNPEKTPTPSPNNANAPLLEFGKCSPHASDWQMPDPGHDKVLYAFMTGQGIYRSEDAGLTLRQEVPLTETTVLDARVDPSTGNVLVALGTKGLMVRTPDGVWRAIPIDKLVSP